MTTTISLHSSVVPIEQQVSCDLNGDAVILNVANGQYYELNPIGARIWQLLQDGRSVLDVRDTLVEEYDVETDRCTADLLGVLAALADAELVRVAG